MAVSTQPKGSNDGTIILKDGTSVTPVTLTIPFTRGDIKVGEMADILNVKNIVQARGRRIGVALGERMFPTITVSAFATGFTAAAADGTPADWMLKRGPYASNVSTLGANKPWTFDATIQVEGTDWGDSADSEATWEDCIGTITWEEGDSGGNAFTLSLTCTGEITGDLAVAGI